MYLPLNSGRSSEEKIWEYKSQIVPGIFKKLFPEKVANAGRCHMLTFYFKSMDNVRLLEIATDEGCLLRKLWSLFEINVKIEICRYWWIEERNSILLLSSIHH